MIKVAPNHDKIRITNPNYGKDVTVHTNRGKQTIPTKQYEAMMDKTKNPTMRDRNEALEAATKVKGIQFDNGIFHNYAPSSNNSFKLEGFYGKWGIVSRLGNTSDPETKYIYRPAKTLKNQNSKTSILNLLLTLNSQNLFRISQQLLIILKNLYRHIL